MAGDPVRPVCIDCGREMGLGEKVWIRAHGYVSKREGGGTNHLALATYEPGHVLCHACYSTRALGGVAQPSLFE